MGPPGPRLERCFAVDPVAGEEFIDPRASHPVGGRHLPDRAAFDKDSSDHQAGFPHPATQAGLRPVCLATSVRFVMKQDTVGDTVQTPLSVYKNNDLLQDPCVRKINDGTATCP